MHRRTALALGLGLPLAWRTPASAQPVAVPLFIPGGPNLLPPHFAAESGGQWVSIEGGANSNRRVLAQIGGNVGFPMAVLQRAPERDLAVRVRLAVVGGDAARAAGLAVRLEGGSGYVAEVDARAGLLRLLLLRGGAATVLAEEAGPLTDGRWYTLDLSAAGPQLRAVLQGVVKLEVTDTALTGAGRVALTVRADTRAVFDDLVLSPES